MNLSLWWNKDQLERSQKMSYAAATSQFLRKVSSECSLGATKRLPNLVPFFLHCVVVSPQWAARHPQATLPKNPQAVLPRWDGERIRKVKLRDLRGETRTVYG